MIRTNSEKLEADNLIDEFREDFVWSKSIYIKNEDKGDTRLGKIDYYTFVLPTPMKGRRKSVCSNFHD